MGMDRVMGRGDSSRPIATGRFQGEERAKTWTRSKRSKREMNTYTREREREREPGGAKLKIRACNTTLEEKTAREWMQATGAEHDEGSSSGDRKTCWNRIRVWWGR